MNMLSISNSIKFYRLIFNCKILHLWSYN